jgi:hypothetical protein
VLKGVKRAAAVERQQHGRSGRTLITALACRFTEARFEPDRLTIAFMMSGRRRRVCGPGVLLGRPIPACPMAQTKRPSREPAVEGSRSSGSSGERPCFSWLWHSRFARFEASLLVPGSSVRGADTRGQARAPMAGLPALGASVLHRHVHRAPGRVAPTASHLRPLDSDCVPCRGAGSGGVLGPRCCSSRSAALPAAREIHNLRERPGGEVLLHDALRRREQAGLLSSTRDGAGRLYRLTAAGRAGDFARIAAGGWHDAPVGARSARKT